MGGNSSSMQLAIQPLSTTMYGKVDLRSAVLSPRTLLTAMFADIHVCNCRLIVFLLSTESTSRWIRHCEVEAIHIALHIRTQAPVIAANRRRSAMTRLAPRQVLGDKLCIMKTTFRKQITTFIRRLHAALKSNRCRSDYTIQTSNVNTQMPIILKHLSIARGYVAYYCGSCEETRSSALRQRRSGASTIATADASKQGRKQWR